MQSTENFKDDMLSSGNNSEAASSDDDTSSYGLDSDIGTPTASTTSSCGIISPRPAEATANTNKPSPAVPKLGLSIPKLDLGATTAADSAPRPSQPPFKPPSLNLKPALDLSGIRDSPGGQAPAPSSTKQIAVELLSPAFQLATMTNGIDLQQQAAGKFGVRRDRVQLFALVPITSVESIPENCQRVAMQVQGSEFSLQALEEVLAENQRLTALASSSQSNSTKNAEVDVLRQEVAHLRQRLTSSELLRHRGQQALQELKEEFETLHFDLMQHTDTVLSARTPRPAGME